MISKIFLFILIFSILFLIREGFMFYKALRNGKKNITDWRLLGVGVSLSYIITAIIAGL